MQRAVDDPSGAHGSGPDGRGRPAQCVLAGVESEGDILAARRGRVAVALTKYPRQTTRAAMVTAAYDRLSPAMMRSAEVTLAARQTDVRSKAEKHRHEVKRAHRQPRRDALTGQKEIGRERRDGRASGADEPRGARGLQPAGHGRRSCPAPSRFQYSPSHVSVIFLRTVSARRSIRRALRAMAMGPESGAAQPLLPYRDRSTNLRHAALASGPAAHVSH